MAYLFELSAECGDRVDNATKFVSLFIDHIFTLNNGTSITCTSGHNDIWMGSNGKWWCRVVANGVSVTGLSRATSDDNLIAELAMMLYDHLRECDGFRFARVGWEVEESLEIDDLVNDRADGVNLPAGLVVNEDVWVRMGSPSIFVPFGNKSLWKPLRDNDYLTLAKFR